MEIEADLRAGAPGHLHRGFAALLIVLFTGLACIGVNFADGQRAEAFVAPPPVLPVSVVVAGGVLVAVGTGVLLYEAWDHRSQIMHFLDHLFCPTGCNNAVAGKLSITSAPNPNVAATPGNTQQFTVLWSSSNSTLASGQWECLTPSGGVYWSANSGNKSFTAGGSNVYTSSCSAADSVIEFYVWTSGQNPNVSQAWKTNLAQRQYSVTTTCRAADGSTTTQTSAATLYVPDSSSDTGGLTIPGCTDTGTHLDQIVVHCADVLPSGALSSDTLASQNCYSESFDPNYNSATSPYADCLYNSGGTPCAINLQYSTANGWVTCVDYDPTCATWSGTTVQQQSSFWRCLWGSHVVPSSNCAQMVFTGPNGTSTTTVQTGGQTFPQTGTNIDPQTGTSSTLTTGPAPDTTDTSGGNCIGGAWSWNPVNWVYVPIKCALKWAFVAQASAIESDWTTVKTSWSGTIVGQATNQFAGIVNAITSLGSGNAGCAGPAVSIPLLYINNWHPLDACSAPMSTVANVCRVALTLVVYIGGAYVVARVLAASFGLQLPSFHDSGDA